jgi:hypothetical protein
MKEYHAFEMRENSASAVLLGPTPDGRLFISGRRNQRTRLRTLEIIQNVVPAHPSTVRVVVGDDMGELHVEASSPRQRFLEAFRLRSEHASAITEQMRAQMATRLIDEYGSAEATPIQSGRLLVRMAGTGRARGLSATCSPDRTRRKLQATRRHWIFLLPGMARRSGI